MTVVDPFEPLPLPPPTVEEVETDEGVEIVEIPPLEHVRPGGVVSGESFCFNCGEPIQGDEGREHATRPCEYNPRLVDALREINEV